MDVAFIDDAGNGRHLARPADGGTTQDNVLRAEAGTTAPVDHRSPTQEPLAAFVRRTAGSNVARCYQCGKCSAGCPMGAEMALPPHDIMRLTLADDRARLFGDDSLWLCLTCETCSARCPKDVDPARVIDALRELAAAEGAGHAPRNIRAFHEAFLEQIRATGRLSEVGLIMQYKLRSGALFQDVAVAPAMLRRGKLPLRPQHVAGVDEVKRIMAVCDRERARAAGAAPAATDGARGDDR